MPTILESLAIGVSEESAEMTNTLLSGYGRSSGSPTQANMTAVFTEAYDWLAARSDVKAEQIIGMGRSLGGGAIMVLSRQRELAAIVLQSAFTSVPAMARSYCVPEWLVSDPFDNESALRVYL